MKEVLTGLMIPFAGTALGSACVYIMKDRLSVRVQKSLQGFAAGVMTAASVWSLILPAIDQSQHLGRFAFAPAAIGILLGIAFLLFLDVSVPHMHLDEPASSGSANLTAARRKRRRIGRLKLRGTGRIPRP